MSGDGIRMVALVILLASAAITDITKHRIPNLLSLTGVVFGLGMQIYLFGGSGLWAGLLGLTVGLLTMLPLYIFASLGAGDVKLMAAVGTFLGPLEVFAAAVFSTLAGGLFAIVLMALRGDLWWTLRRYGEMLRHIVLAREALYIPPAAGETAGRRAAYAPAIAAGTIASLWYFSHFEPVLRHLGRGL